MTATKALVANCATRWRQMASAVRFHAARIHRRLLREMRRFASNHLQFYLDNCLIEGETIDIYGQYTKRGDFCLDVMAGSRAIQSVTKRHAPGRNDFVVSLPRTAIQPDDFVTLWVDGRPLQHHKLVDPLSGRLSHSKCMIATMIKNEESRVIEWARWHLSLGFDAIVVFLNNTTDGSRAVLESMHDSRIVIVQFDYHAAPGGHWTDVQRIQLSIAGRIAKQFSQWAAFIDVDEFIVLQGRGKHVKPCVREFVERFARAHPQASAVRMQSFFYTNERDSYMPSQDVVENCRMRSLEPNLRYAKFIARSAKLEDFITSPHARPGDVVVDPEEISIAHYWLQTSLYSHCYPRDLPKGFQANDDAVRVWRQLKE